MSSAARPGGKRRLTGRILSAALLGAAVWFLVRTAGHVGWDALAARLSGASPALLAAVLAVNLARYVAWALRWQALARPATPFPLWPAVRALMASLYVTTVVPGSRSFGGLVRARHLARALGRPMGPIYGGALVDQIGYSIVSMILGAIFVLGYWGQRSGVGNKGFWVAGAGGLLFVSLAVDYRKREALLRRLRARSPGLADGIGGTMAAARDLLSRPASWAIMGAGGFVVYAANIAGLQLAAAALGAPMGFVVAAGAFSIGSLAGTIANTPGGLGATEWAAVQFLGRVADVPEEVALASVLLARGAHYVCSVAVGGVFTFGRTGAVDGPA